MIKIIDEIRDIFNKKELIPKLVSLMLAVFLWAYIGTTKIGEIKFKVPIEIKNLSKSLVISNIQRNSIIAILKGNKEDLNNVNLKNLKVFVDLKNPVIGDSVKYPIEVVKQQIPENIDFSLSTDKIAITIEKKFSKRVKVIPIVTGKVQDGYVLGNIRVNPEYIALSGPKSIVNDINSVKTNVITVENETANIKRGVSIDKGNLKNIEINDVNVTVVITIFNSINLYRFNKRVELKGVDDNFSCKILNNKNIKIFVKTTGEKAAVSEDDFYTFIDISSLNLKKIFKKSNENYIIEEFPIRVSPKSSDNIKFIYIVPEKISVKIMKK